MQRFLPFLLLSVEPLSAAVLSLFDKDSIRRLSLLKVDEFDECSDKDCYIYWPRNPKNLSSMVQYRPKMQ